MILDQFDENKIAVINPTDVVEKVESMPKVAITCFSYETFERLVSTLNGEEIARLYTTNMVIPIYRVSYKDSDIALFISETGAPSCVAELEEIFEIGVETVIMFGTCGVLDASIKDCSVIIPNVAVRDEGTSYHYAPASDEIPVNPKYMDKFVEILNQQDCNYTIGKTWTTDAIYRETRDKVNRRKEAGCICVEMVCSAVAALAQFRDKEVFHFSYAADNLDNEVWDKRSLSNSDNLLEKDKVAFLAAELAVKICGLK